MAASPNDSLFDSKAAPSASISSLSVEVLQNVFYHFDSNEDSKVMFDCLTISKAFWSAMAGPALLNEINIKRIQQLPQLVSYLVANSAHALSVKILRFTLDPPDYQAHAPEVNYYGLSHLYTLLQLTIKLHTLYDPPTFESSHSDVWNSISRLKFLRRLSVRAYSNITAPDNLPHLYSFNLSQVHHLCAALPQLAEVFFDNYSLDLPSEFGTCSLMHISKLSIWNCALHPQGLTTLLRAPAKRLTKLSFNTCEDIEVDDLIRIVAHEAPGLSILRINDCFDVGTQCSQHDFLTSFSDLEEVAFSGDVLAWDSLLYLGPKVHRLTLEGGVTTLEVVGILLGLMNRAEGGCSKIKVVLDQASHTDREQKYLKSHPVLKDQFAFRFKQV